MTILSFDEILNATHGFQQVELAPGEKSHLRCEDCGDEAVQDDKGNWTGAAVSSRCTWNES